MFTGIIEATGSILSISAKGSNKTFHLTSSLSPQLRIDQSLSHDGVCLTVEAVNGDGYQVTAIAETLEKSNLGTWKEGGKINLERCLVMNGRLDGHIVQGHVDTTARCISRQEQSGSWLFRFSFPPAFGNLVIEKGSIAVNGISLTCFDVSHQEFSVAIIPYTFDNTNIRDLIPGASVNIEFDMIGKYVERMIRNGRPPYSGRESGQA
jgi:riboflavin synthase